VVDVLGAVVVVVELVVVDVDVVVVVGGRVVVVVVARVVDVVVGWVVGVVTVVSTVGLSSPSPLVRATMASTIAAVTRIVSSTMKAIFQPPPLPEPPVVVGGGCSGGTGGTGGGVTGMASVAGSGRTVTCSGAVGGSPGGGASVGVRRARPGVPADGGDGLGGRVRVRVTLGRHVRHGRLPSLGCTVRSSAAR
jgi:hypothetical protein